MLDISNALGKAVFVIMAFIIIVMYMINPWRNWRRTRD